MNTYIGTSIRPRQRGVTLIELMISLLLGVLLTAGIIQVFGANRQTYEFTQSLSRIQENARFALDHIAYNTRMAGYSGCLSNVRVYNNLAAPSPFRDDIENGVRGHDADGTAVDDEYSAATPSSTWDPALPAELAGRVLAGSDVLVVRGLAGGGVSLVSPFTNAAQLFVTDADDFEIGEIAVVSDCQKASIFQITNIDSSGAPVNVVHSNAGFTPGNAMANWPAEQDYGLGAQLAHLRTHAFYVGQGANGPALFQRRLRRLGPAEAGIDDPEELIEGVDTMQIRYGEDTDNDGAINAWRSAGDVGNWLNVLSVEISLLARAPEEYGTETDTTDYDLGGMQFDPVDDRRLRQVLSTSVGVRNRLP